METNAQHYTNASFHKTFHTLGKICATSDKTTTTKTTSRKKNKKTSRKPKKTKKPRVSGKGLGGHFSQIHRFFFLFFFVFSSFFVFFCVFWFSRVLFFVFFDFSNDFSEVFSEVLPFGLFITDFAQTALFPQNFARAAPQHVCNIFSKANSFFISLLLGKSLLE